MTVLMICNYVCILKCLLVCRTFIHVCTRMFLCDCNAFRLIQSSCWIVSNNYSDTKNQRSPQVSFKPVHFMFTTILHHSRTPNLASYYYTTEMPPLFHNAIKFTLFTQKAKNNFKEVTWGGSLYNICPAFHAVSLLLHFPPLHLWPYCIFHSRIFNRPIRTSVFAPSKGLFWNGIHKLLRRADAKESAGIIYHTWRISLCESGIVIEVRM